MSKWRKIKLGDIADVKLSNVDKKTNFGERGVRLCNYTDVYKNQFIDSRKAMSFMIATCSDSELEKFILREGQVAITKDSEKRNDIGISTYISESFDDVILGYHLALITPFDGLLDGKFLNYWFKTTQAKKYFENNVGGSGQRFTLTLDTIKSISVNLPEYFTQRQIAAVLSALDDKIDLNNRINAELEQMAKTIYDYWFVQFDFPDANGKPYKSSGGKMVYNEVLKRKVPEGWEVKNLDELASITTGKLDSNAEIINGKYNFYTCAAEPSKTDSYAYDDDVVLIAGNNAAGNFHINRYKGKFNAYQRTYIITAKIKSSLEYLYQTLKIATKSFKDKGNGSQTKFLTIGMLTTIKIFSNCHLIEEYFKVVNPMHLKQVCIENQNQQLSSLRGWLLPMLMNGQVTVLQAYEQVKEVLSMTAED